MAYSKFDWERALGDCEELSASAHHAGLTLASWIHSTRLSGWVKQDEIARRMKRSRRHVNRALKELEDAGWIQREAGHQGRNGRPGRTTTYRVMIPEKFLATRDSVASVRDQSHRFVQELCSAISYEWYNDPNYLKSAAPLVAVISGDIESGLLNDVARGSAAEWCARTMPNGVRSLSGVLYSRYMEWRLGYLPNDSSASAGTHTSECTEDQSVHSRPTDSVRPRARLVEEKSISHAVRQAMENLGLTFVEQKEIDDE